MGQLGSGARSNSVKEKKSYHLPEIVAVEALQDVEEAVEEERVVLNELVVLGHLGRDEQAQLRVDRRQPLDLPAAAARRRQRHRRLALTGADPTARARRAAS